MKDFDDGADGSKRKNHGRGRSPKSKCLGTGSLMFDVKDGHVRRRVVSEGPDGDEEVKWVPFVTEMQITHRVRSFEGDDWGLLVHVVDPDGVSHQYVLPARLLAGNGESIRAELLNMGMRSVPGVTRWASWLTEYIQSADPERRARCVSSVGWHHGAFVLPDQTFGAEDLGEEVILQTGDRLDHAYNVAGSIEDWQEKVARFVEGNSRLQFGVAAAFAAPLLELMGLEGGGFHFRGSSSTGKSTALAVAGSVFGGGGRGYLKSWRTTDNALESICAMHNSTALMLDELSQANPATAAQSAYMIANGKGKSRARKDGQARAALDWRLIFLSTGEVGLADKLREGGGQIAAGMEVRIVDIRADAGAGLGIFEDIHGSESAGAFAQELKRAASAVYGSPGRAFVDHLAQNHQEVASELAEHCASFLQQVVPDSADGQVRRVAERFALVAAAGELATELGITSWTPGSCIDAAKGVFFAWLNERGGKGAAEVAQVKDRLRQAIEMDGEARFAPWTDDGRRVVHQKLLGYVKRPDDASELDEATYFLTTSGLKELTRGMDHKAMVKALGIDGVLAEQYQGGRPELLKQHRVPTIGSTVRLYELSLAALWPDTESVPSGGPDDQGA